MCEEVEEARGAYLLVGPIVFPDILRVLTQALEYLFDRGLCVQAH